MILKHIEDAKADVLVIGSGAAGLMAAIEARKCGADVLLIDKVVLATNNNTRYSGGGLKAALPGILSDAYTRIFDTPSEHFREALIHGEFMNDQDLIETLCYEAPGRLLDLKELGVPHFGEIYLKIPYPHGTAISKPLYKRVRNMGCRTSEAYVCVDLLRSRDNRVTGIVAIDVYGKKVVSIQAKATVLATGGAGEVYKRNDTTANTTGDGFAIAYRAGAELRDMEFVQFEPYVQAEPGLPMMDRHECQAEFYGILKNKHGQDFLRDYIKSRTAGADAFHVQYGYHLTDIRELVSRAMAQEVMDGRGEGGAVFFDLRHVGDDKWQSDIASRYTKQVLLRGFETESRLLHVFPGAIHNLGGIAINVNGETGLEGLFAAGECTGGVHGAARLGGDGLVDPIVYGARAGRAASRLARQKGFAAPANKLEVVESLRSVLTTERKKTQMSTLYEIKGRLQNVMWDYVSMLRNERDLRTAVKQIENVQKELFEEVKVDTPRKLKEFLQVRNMAVTASLIANSALRREESRGSHYRSDYPYRDDKHWLRNIFIQRDPEGNPLFDFRDVDDSRQPHLQFSKFGLEVRG